jgi:hypothetical protein
LRLPAYELEALVLERLAPILTIAASANRSTTQVDSETDGAEAGPGHIDAARPGSTATHRCALLKLVRRITVAQDRLLIRLDEHGNTTGSHCDAADETGSDEAASLHLDPLQLTVPYRAQCCRGEIRLLSADGSEPSVRSPNHALVKAVAPAVTTRARDCLAEGEGFEPSVRLPVQRFSRPPRSTTPAPLRGAFWRRAVLADLACA